MKNINLTGLYLALVAQFGVSGFELSSMKKIDSTEPTDALILFKDGNAGVFDLGKINEILKENITGDVKEAGVSLKQDKIEIYIEFLSSDASHWDN